MDKLTDFYTRGLLLFSLRGLFTDINTLFSTSMKVAVIADSHAYDEALKHAVNVKGILECVITKES